MNNDKWLKGVIYNNNLSKKDIEIKKLEERISKAIEYIKYWTQDGGIILSWESVIKILEGEEVE